jgi:hypothetical protein
MGFVEREMAQLRAELAKTPDGPLYDRLYAASSALAWTLEPSCIMSPYDYIMGGKVAGKEDCPTESRPPASSDICVLNGSPR